MFIFRLRGRQYLLVGVAVTLAAVLSSCALPVQSNDTTHYLILGFGIVSVHENSKDAIVATDTRDVGLCITDRPGVKLQVGYLASTVVSVADGAKDVRVEASRLPFGPLTVSTTKADLFQSSNGVNK